MCRIRRRYTKPGRSLHSQVWRSTPTWPTRLRRNGFAEQARAIPMWAATKTVINSHNRKGGKYHVARGKSFDTGSRCKIEYSSPLNGLRDVKNLALNDDKCTQMTMMRMFFRVLHVAFKPIGGTSPSDGRRADCAPSLDRCPAGRRSGRAYSAEAATSAAKAGPGHPQTGWARVSSPCGLRRMRHKP